MSTSIPFFQNVDQKPTFIQRNFSFIHLLLPFQISSIFALELEGLMASFLNKKLQMLRNRFLAPFRFSNTLVRKKLLLFSEILLSFSCFSTFSTFTFVLGPSFVPDLMGNFLNKNYNFKLMLGNKCMVPFR